MSAGVRKGGDAVSVMGVVDGVLPRSARPFGIFSGIAGGLLSASTLLWLAGCAHVEAPSGGPADLKRPQVAAVYPAPGATGVPLNANMVFQFDEWVDRIAARNQVLISPPYPGRARLEVDGNRITVSPSGGVPLRANTTHAVTVLGTLKDLHENSMGGGFSLRFSTGASLDSAVVEGRLSVTGGRGTLMAVLYPTVDRTGTRSTVTALSPRDTGFRPAPRPEPWRELPAWISAADSTGRFRADAVAAGDYAFFAFEDVNGNFTFDMGVEAAATGEPAVALRPRAPDQTLRLTPLDTLPLRIAEVTFAAEAAPKRVAADSLDTLVKAVPPPDTVEEFLPGALRVRFTHAPQPARALEPGRYRVLPDSGDAVPVRGVSWSGEKNIWLLDVPPLRANMRHRVEMRGRPDLPGRAGLETPDTSAIFVVDRASALPEEWALTPVTPTPPAPAETAGAGTNGASGLPRMETAPARGSLQTFFSNLPLDAARWTMLETRLDVRLMDDSLPRPLRVRRAGSRVLAFDLESPLNAGGALILQLRPPVGDSTPPKVLYSGKAADSSTQGGLRFLASSGTPAGAPLVSRDSRVFWLSPTVETEALPVEYGLVRAGDSLKAASVPAGRYSLFSFRDRDGDGVWDPGSLKPWIPQEPFETVLDTVTVRAGIVTDVTKRMKNSE